MGRGWRKYYSPIAHTYFIGEPQIYLLIHLKAARYCLCDFVSFMSAPNGTSGEDSFSHVLSQCVLQLEGYGLGSILKLDVVWQYIILYINTINPVLPTDFLPVCGISLCCPKFPQNVQQISKFKVLPRHTCSSKRNNFAHERAFHGL